MGGSNKCGWIAGFGRWLHGFRFNDSRHDRNSLAQQAALVIGDGLGQIAEERTENLDIRRRGPPDKGG